MRTGFVSAWLVGTVALLAAGAGWSDTSGSFKLALRPTPTAILYDEHLLRNRTDITGDVKSTPALADTNQVLSRMVTANPDGTISVNDTVLGDESFYSDRKVQPDSDVPPPEPPRRGALYSPRGERMSAPEKADPDMFVEPVFPAEAIAPGHKWQSVVEFPPSSSQKVTVNHEFVAVEVVNGMPCAIVVSDFEVKNGKRGPSHFACKANGRVGLSLTDGALVNAQSFFTLVEKTVVPTTSTMEGTKIELLRTLTRRVADAGGGTPGK